MWFFDLILNIDFVVFVFRYDLEWLRVRVFGVNFVWFDYIFVFFGVLVDFVWEVFNVIDVFYCFFF